MKYFILSFFLISACAAKPSNIEKIADPLLTNLLVFGEVKDLNKISNDIEKNLWVKLYKVPSRVDNNCFPESHGICSYDYYLTTSQIDDSPIFNAYSLGTYGELLEPQWQKTNSDEEKAIINLNVNQYSQLALQYNKKLKNNESIYQLVVTSNKISFSKIE